MTRAYGPVRAVDRVSLQIESGEFFAMLGPSGSGKTTCLRLIAGFEPPDKGQILLDGQDVTSLPPYERDVNTVFQDYALFPHMSVIENVAYGLRVRKVAKAEQRRRALEMLDLVKLSDLAERRPSQLSGGQRQRVSLARALINQPRVLLLDEPLGALDLKLREEMQIELKNLQRRLGITFVFVTHDQGEALSMAHRVAVFKEGRIEQIDTPRALYARPRTPFVARFVGSANIIDGAFAVRAEDVRVTDGEPPPEHIKSSGVISDIQFLGAACRIHVELDEKGPISALSQDDGGHRVGQRVNVHWSPDDAVPLEGAP